jgi:hypothetical protein
MKRLNVILFFVVLLLSCKNNSTQAQVTVGKIENAIAVITANKETLLKNYNSNLLKLSAITGNFTEVAITLIDGSYYLVFKGTQYKSSLKLTSKPKTGRVLLIDEGDGGGGGHVSCTTSDCSSEPTGCVPSKPGLACTPCANKGKCTKTVSLTSLLEE